MSLPDGTCLQYGCLQLTQDSKSVQANCYLAGVNFPKHFLACANRCGDLHTQLSCMNVPDMFPVPKKLNLLELGDNLNLAVWFKAAQLYDRNCLYTLVNRSLHTCPPGEPNAIRGFYLGESSW